MSDLHVNVSEAISKLNEFIEGVDARQADLSTANPQFAHHAAGRDFTHHAQRIQSKLARINAQRHWRLNNMRNTATAALAEMEKVRVLDEDNAGTLRAFRIGEAK